MKRVPDSQLILRQSNGMPMWLLIVTTLLSVAVALVSFRYLSPSAQAPAIIQGNTFRTPWLMIHAAGAASALLFGPAQFFPRLRAAWSQVHRWVGRLYVLGCTVGGVSGLVLAMGASTGAVTSLGFATLAVAWLVSTHLAWYRALQGRIGAHRRWMIRSFALTLAAVTLRLYLPIAALLPLPFATSYQAIAYLCWIPNLLLAERYLRRTHANPAG